MNVIEIAENLVVGSDKEEVAKKAQQIINVCEILGIEVKNREVPTQYDGEPIAELFLKLSVTADNQEASLEDVAKAYMQLKARSQAEVKAASQSDKKQPLTAEDVFKKTTGLEVNAIPKGSIYELHWKRLKQQIEPLAKQMYIASLQNVVELTNSWMFDGTPEEDGSYPFFSEEQETTVDQLLESGSDHFQNFRLQQQDLNQKTIASSSKSLPKLTGI